ncbi:hypothetical protein [Pusillimonas sp.]|uniref:purine-cytosine permease family protein n=1 Tax=Pusillimonas sp. TaxID=3040095 RepID=UPI0029B653B4|nr:hypothetical protein [Pusillimonas sp.]MDX3893693.1 hypothetical protein [Pusillimonas sp.]
MNSHFVTDRAETNSFEGHEHDAQHRLDDYARTRVPESEKRGTGSILSVLVGIVTAFFFLFLGGLFLQNYGATATWIGVSIGFVLTTSLCWITCFAASREGLTAELMTRGCGFGSIGSVLTTLIYGVTFVILAATEAQILATNIALVWDLPDIVWYVFVAAIFVPMVWGGIANISKLLSWSTLLYLPLIVVAIWLAWGHMPEHITDASALKPPELTTGGWVGVIAIMGTLSSIVGLNPLESADYNRYIKHESYRRASWVTVVLPYALMYFVAIPMGMYFASATGEINPGIYFVGLLGLALGVALAWVSQVRINLTNIHLGSIAFASASGQFGGSKLGRRFWTIVVLIAVVVLMVLDVLGNLTLFLEWNGIFLLAWVGCLVSDLLIVREALKIVEGPIEYRSSRLRKYNPVGIIALVTATLIGSLAWSFSGDSILRGLSGYIAFAVAAIVHAVLAAVTQGRYYFADSGDERLRVRR